MEIVNKVANAKLDTVDLLDFQPAEGVDAFDLKDFLWMEYVLKEADFRSALEAYDWEKHRGRHLAVFCSNDAIIAYWAFMLVAAKATGIARSVRFGAPDQVRGELWLEAIRAHDFSRYAGRRVIVKGCGDESLPPAAYVAVTERLGAVADRVMYGEACSFVPVLRKR